MMGLLTYQTVKQDVAAIECPVITFVLLQSLKKGKDRIHGISAANRTSQNSSLTT